MADDLDLERKKLEVIKLEGTIAEQDFKVKERMADIDRIKDHKKKAQERQKELRQEIADWNNKGE